MRFLFFIFLLTSCFYASDNSSYFLKLEQFSPHRFKRPVDFIYPNSKVAYVVEQEGKLWQIDIRQNYKKTLILNIKKRVSKRNEQGLLCMVLDPKFQTNKFVYLFYTTYDYAVVSRWLFDKKKLTKEQVLLKIKQPYSNHNGGQLAFGNDGYLYIGVGDGGAAGDPLKAGQDLNTLLGKILRIDVNNLQGYEIARYGIPKDNPFIDQGREEIYAYGFRNPWTFSFDSKTQFLICADVGQNKREEVNFVIKGGNYGWSIKEAELDYDRSQTSMTKLIDPIASYDRKQGISITGGFVYRGKEIKKLQGFYLYTDYGSGKLWGLKLDKKGQVIEKRKFREQRLRVSRFAQDYKRELYLCSFAKGKILKIVGVEAYQRK